MNSSSSKYFHPPLSSAKTTTAQINRIVNKILSKQQRIVAEQQLKFVKKDDEEKKKRNNYVVEKYTSKVDNESGKKVKAEEESGDSKENTLPSTMPTSKVKKKKKPVSDSEDDDFVQTPAYLKSKRRKVTPNLFSPVRTIDFFLPSISSPPRPTPLLNDSVHECLDSIIIQIENLEVTCPFCPRKLSHLNDEQRLEHVNRCLEESDIMQKKLQTTLDSFSSSRKTVSTSFLSSSRFKCQICGSQFNTKPPYLTHLKKCSTRNSVQLSHVVNFASNLSTGDTTAKGPPLNIKNRVIRMEEPENEDQEQQQLAIALSTSLKVPNAFDILQQAAKKTKITDLALTPLWSVSLDEKKEIYSDRLSRLCERVVSFSLTNFSLRSFFSTRLLPSANFKEEYWRVAGTDVDNDATPSLTQLAQLLADNVEEEDEEMLTQRPVN